MQLTDILAQMGGLQSIARELGINETQVAQGAEALIPAILGGFKKQAESQPGGVEGLSGLLGQLGGSGLLDNVLSPQATDISKGNDVLAHIFGSKDVSQSVAQSAASQSGLDSNLLQKMLPMLAMLVAGYMSKQSGAAPAAQLSSALGGFGGLLGGVLGNQASSGSTGGGLGGIAAILDMNKNGNSLDDIASIAGKFLR